MEINERRRKRWRKRRAIIRRGDTLRVRSHFQFELTDTSCVSSRSIIKSDKLSFDPFISLSDPDPVGSTRKLVSVVMAKARRGCPAGKQEVITQGQLLCCCCPLGVTKSGGRVHSVTSHAPPQPPDDAGEGGDKFLIWEMEE